MVYGTNIKTNTATLKLAEEKMKKEIKVNITVQIPETPNFLIGEDGKPIAIYKFPEWVLKEIAKKWTNKFLQKARERRKKYKLNQLP